MERIRVSVVGASGYVGGELLRLLLRHPFVEIAQITSESHAGEPVHRVHPHLRRLSAMTFCRMAELRPCDALFVALPHGEVAPRIEGFAAVAPVVIDLSADFRLRDPEAYPRWYGRPHPHPEWLSRFVYGLPERYREELRGARYISGVGCNAAAAILALWPLIRADVLDPERPILVDIKAGSSEAGREPNPSSHHPERHGAIRPYAPVGHRHTAEVRQALGRDAIFLSVTAVDAVRGVLAVAHAWPRLPLAESDLWRIYRAAYGEEPFIRLVKDRQGLHRLPDPKAVVGSNFADVGFAVEEETGRIVALCALDNLMKGAAGSAVQSLNVAMGWPETTGLDLIPIYPA
ncbi:MAG TPA: N-acetyl-gamma-glutamyl-phosphate reductase [Thermoflexus sp.]|nr:N-acetyl-gamma-glutamyl-phosphate reductase [Thermoflexus sp.]